jgi:tetratricopeptide (TPR) repeat protein
MKFTWKKVLLVSILFLAFVVLPIGLLSTGMMEHYQERIDRNPDTDFNKWLQMATADACSKTMRPEMAADYYRRFWERYPKDERRPVAYLHYAVALADSGRNADAIAAFQKYMDDYPEREDRKVAVAGIERIRFVKPAP